MLSEFGDACNESVISCAIEEDGVIGFLFDFTLGPFLNKRGVTLAPAFFWLAALVIDYLVFLPATGVFPIVCGYKYNINLIKNK